MDSAVQLQHEVVALIPALRRFARRFHRNENDVDDLVQETLTRALASIHLFKPGTQLKSWLFTIMRNSFLSQYQRNKRFVFGLDDIIEKSRVAPSQEWIIRGKELQTAFRDLPDNLHEAMKMVFLDGENYEDVARKCNCALGTVKSRVSRGRMHLAKVLGDGVSNAASI